MARTYSEVAFTQAITRETYELRIDAAALTALIEQHGDQLKALDFNVDNPDDPVNEAIIPLLVAITETAIDQEIVVPGADEDEVFTAVVTLVAHYRAGKTLFDFTLKH